MLEATLFMSTLALVTQPATTAPAPPDVPWIALWIALGFLGTVSVGLTVAAWFLGAFRQGVQGPPRIGAGHPVWPVAVALGAAVLAMLAAGVAGAAALDLHLPEPAAEELLEPPSAVDTNNETTEMVNLMQVSAISYTAAAAAGLLALLVARRRGWTGSLGFAPRYLPRGLLTGALALVLVIPWMLTAAVLLQVVRKALGYSPDAVHEILRAIRENPQPEVILWGVLSAVVIAPLAEEILFRGLLQTTLVYGLARLFARSQPLTAPVAVLPLGVPGGAAPAVLPATGGEAHDLAYWHRPPPPVLEKPDPSAAFRWAGILTVSALFAVLHEPWSIPLIFLLSLFFGYLYERTGNLWTSIVVHFGFNSLNLLVVLLGVLLGSA